MSSQTRHTNLSDLQPQPAFEDRLCTDSSKMNIGHQFSQIEGTYLPGIHRAGDSMYPTADFQAGSSASSPPEWFQPDMQYEMPQEATHRGTGCTGISGRSKATRLSTSDASMLQSHPNDSQESALDASYMASGSNSEHKTLDPRKLWHPCWWSTLKQEADGCYPEQDTKSKETLGHSSELAECFQCYGMRMQVQMVIDTAKKSPRAAVRSSLGGSTKSPSIVASGA